MPPQSRPQPPSHPGAPRPIPDVHPGAPRPNPDTHPGAPRPVPSGQVKPPDLPLGPPPSGPPPTTKPQAQSPMQPQTAPPSAQSQLPPPMQPTLPAPLQPQQAAPPAAATPPAAGTPTAASPGPQQSLASPKPPPRSRSSHALPPDAAKSESTPSAQTNGLNGFQREAQWKPDPFDSLTSDLFSSSLSSSRHTTQSLNRDSSLRAPPSAYSSSTLPPSISLQSYAFSDLKTPSSSSSSALSTPFAASLLPPPPVPSRSRSQEILRASPNLFRAETLPARPSSTNPFSGPLFQQQLPQRSLTPDFTLQHQTQAADLQRTHAFSQPLFPTPTLAPSSQVSLTMPLFEPLSGPNPTQAPPAFDPSPALTLPLAPPSSLPPALAPQYQPPPPSRGKQSKQWVTFDDELNIPPTTKTQQNPIFPSSSLVPQTLTPSTRLLFDSEPEWLSSLPPHVPNRTSTSNPNLPQGPTNNGFFS